MDPALDPDMEVVDIGGAEADVLHPRADADAVLDAPDDSAGAREADDHFWRVFLFLTAFVTVVVGVFFVILMVIPINDTCAQCAQCLLHEGKAGMYAL